MKRSCSRVLKDGPVLIGPQLCSISCRHPDTISLNLVNGVHCRHYTLDMVLSGLMVRFPALTIIFGALVAHFTFVTGEIHKKQRIVMLPSFSTPEIKALFPVMHRFAEAVSILFR